MATKAAPSKTYDPVKALEGMFNGSVTRIAYALRDPANYGASTKTVLTEAAKRFHDALDDCEVQLLDAKWYLEYQLEQNRLRREAKARELGTSAKRRHEEIKESQPEVHEETPTKKAKIEEDEKPEAKIETTKTQPTEEQTNVLEESKASKETIPSKAKAPEETTAQDDFAKPIPQASPAATNEDLNFESMFGDTNITGTDNDLGFDLGLEGGFDDSQDPNSLNSLIPDLDDFTIQNADNPTSNATGDPLPTFSNDFGLPEIGGTNVFDDFLNDENLGGDLGDNVDLSDQALLNMDFDDSLF